MVGLGLLTLTGALVFAVLGWSTFRTAPFQRIEIEPLIATGNATAAAISPEGRYLAYSLSETVGGQSLWLRDLTSGANIQVGAASQAGYGGLTFSGDGGFLRFFQAGSLYQMPALGGTPKKLSQASGGYVALSADGKRIAFRIRANDETAVVVASLDGSNERKLAVRKSPESLQGISWSPDGKLIACVVGTSVFAGTEATVVTLDPNSGKQTAIAPRKWWSIDDLQWLPNGRGLLMVIREPPLKAFRPWYLSYPGGETHPVTNDLMDYTTVRPTADSSSFVSVQQGDLSSLWVTSADGTGTTRRISEGLRRRDGVGGLAWTPDGRIVFVSSFTGIMQIWITNADGSEARRLSAEGVAGLNPHVCPNGRYILYNSDAGPEGRHVWRMELDGSKPQQLTFGPDESWPICSPDSDWVMYISVSPEKRTLMKVSIDGGTPALITEEPIVMPSISPDGKTILGTYSIGSVNQVVIMPREGGPVKKLFPIERPKVHWSPNGRSVMYAETKDGVRNIWSRPLDGSAPRELTRFADNEDIRWFGVSPDGGRLAVARGTVVRDVVRIRNVK